MRIGLYGMPTSGKSYILDKITYIDTFQGSRLLREIDPMFDSRNDTQREFVRKQLAERLIQHKSFIMDGHYAFGDKTVFTDSDGQLYDVIIYLYIEPNILKKRMSESERNSEYLKYDIEQWQRNEIECLRDYCHRNDKDFYVIDNPPAFYFEDISRINDFIHVILDGFSCLNYAQKCADDILAKSKTETVILLDGDKTLTTEDTSNTVFGYKTHLYDGNFYSGYQSWRQGDEFSHYSFADLTRIPVPMNDYVYNALTEDSYILTSGHKRVWSFISETIGVDFYCGIEMAAETKYFITKKLQLAGKKVVAYGDGMNDYYMLKQADKGYLVTKADGTISRSLKYHNVEGLTLV